MVGVEIGGVSAYIEVHRDVRKVWGFSNYKYGCDILAKKKKKKKKTMKIKKYMKLKIMIFGLKIIDFGCLIWLKL